MKMSWKLSKWRPGISKLVRCAGWRPLRCNQEASSARDTPPKPSLSWSLGYTTAQSPLISEREDSIRHRFPRRLCRVGPKPQVGGRICGASAFRCHLLWITCCHLKGGSYKTTLGLASAPWEVNGELWNRGTGQSCLGRQGTCVCCCLAHLLSVASWDLSIF